VNDDTQLSDADLLRAYLEDAGLSQRAAARELAIDERTMRRYCAGDQKVPPTVFLSIKHLGTIKRNEKVIAMLRDGTLSTSDGALTIEQFEAHNRTWRRAVDYLTRQTNTL
jgi:hypothetical protein